VGQNIRVIVPKKFASSHDGFVARYQKSRMKRIIGEIRTGITAVKKDGSEIPVVLKVSELNSGNATAFIGVMKNISFETELFKIKKMMSNMLPRSIAQRYQNGESDISENVEGSVIFIEIVDFHDFCQKHDAQTLIKHLNKLFGLFDDLLDKFKCEKVKTVSQQYMAICASKNADTGEDKYDYATRAINYALKAVELTRKETQFSVICAIATGNMVQGLLVGHKMAFEVWGRCIGKAANLLQYAHPNVVLLDDKTQVQTSHKFRFLTRTIEQQSIAYEVSPNQQGLR